MPGGRKRDHLPDRWVSAVKDRSLLVLGTVTVAGVGLVAAGWVIQGAAYVPGLLMQLGASMMLLVPLALLGFVLEGRLRHTEEQLKTTVARLDTLTAVTRQRLAESRRQRDDLFDMTRRTPTQERIRALLEDASLIGAIDPAGLRVQLPGTSLRLRFCQQDNSIKITIEEYDGTAIEEMTWNEAEPAAVFGHRLAERLEALDRYPGDASFDPAAVIQRLLEVLQLGVRSRTGETPNDLGRLIEIPNDQWAISAEGLFSLQPHYHISAQSITNSHDDWPRHMRTLSWVDATAFNEAFRLARHLLKP